MERQASQENFTMDQRKKAEERTMLRRLILGYPGIFDLPLGFSSFESILASVPDEISSVLASDRRRLAKILHDGLCQDLMGATMLAQVHAANLASEQHARADEAIAVRNALKKASDDLHALYVALEPAAGSPSG